MQQTKKNNQLPTPEWMSSFAQMNLPNLKSLLASESERCFSNIEPWLVHICWFIFKWHAYKSTHKSQRELFKWHGCHTSSCHIYALEHGAHAKNNNKHAQRIQNSLFICSQCAPIPDRTTEWAQKLENCAPYKSPSGRRARRSCRERATPRWYGAQAVPSAYHHLGIRSILGQNHNDRIRQQLAK